MKLSAVSTQSPWLQTFGISRHSFRPEGGQGVWCPRSPHPTVCPEPSHVAVGKPDRLPILAAVPGEMLHLPFHPHDSPVNRCSQHPHPKVQPRREFPGSPEVITPRFHCRGARVQSLVRELRSCKPRGTAPPPKESTAKEQSPDRAVPYPSHRGRQSLALSYTQLPHLPTGVPTYPRKPPLATACTLGRTCSGSCRGC